MPSLTRRHLLATAAVTGGLGAALAGTGGAEHDPTEADGWRHPQATPGNTAATESSGPRSAERVDWSHEITPTHRRRFRGLARHGDTLLIPTHRRLFGVSTDGERRFEVGPGSTGFDSLASQLDSGPRVFGDTCFLTAGVSVYALDAATGRPRWRHDVNSSIDGVVLLGNTLYLAALVDGDDALVAVDATDGTRRWRRDGRLVPLAASATHLVVAEYDTGALRGVDPETGAHRWTSDPGVAAPSLSPAAVALGDETLWHVQDGSLAAADATTGEVRWREEVADDGPENGARLAVADAVYVLEPDADRLTAIDPTGDRRWSRSVDDAAYGVAVGGATAYVATHGGLEAVATADGATRFRVTPASTPGDALTPLVADGAVYGLAGDTLYGVTDR